MNTGRTASAQNSSVFIEKSAPRHPINIFLRVAISSGEDSESILWS